MANNRMFLVNKVTGAKLTIAKYYPSTGWYVFGDDLTGALNKIFDDRDFGPLTLQQREENAASPGLGVPHPSVGGDRGGNEWEIQYEEEDKP